MTDAELEAEAYERGDSSSLSDTGTSVFDPVLCELSYAWYSAEGDRVLDPFAGGSVRGIVAERMGRAYTGIELRAEQVEANVAQGNELCRTCPTWIQGDSAKMDELLDEDGFDLLFTCPPYADLEVYSEDPADISNMGIDGFLEMYEVILRKAVAKLAEDRFAVVVIGDARGRDGFYYNLPGKTVEIMERAGARYYNEAILVTPPREPAHPRGQAVRCQSKAGQDAPERADLLQGRPQEGGWALGRC